PPARWPGRPGPWRIMADPRAGPHPDRKSGHGRARVAAAVSSDAADHYWDVHRRVRRPGWRPAAHRVTGAPITVAGRDRPVQAALSAPAIETRAARRAGSSAASTAASPERARNSRIRPTGSWSETSLNADAAASQP